MQKIEQATPNPAPNPIPNPNPNPNPKPNRDRDPKVAVERRKTAAKGAIKAAADAAR